jgi:NADH dehydrogenase (ubiquinone) 1 alpha subcomplex subunit 2
MKKHNPHTPIMIREALGVEPKVFARYGGYALEWHRHATGSNDEAQLIILSSI